MILGTCACQYFFNLKTLVSYSLCFEKLQGRIFISFISICRCCGKRAEKRKLYHSGTPHDAKVDFAYPPQMVFIYKICCVSTIWKITFFFHQPVQPLSLLLMRKNAFFFDKKKRKKRIPSLNTRYPVFHLSFPPFKT